MPYNRPTIPQLLNRFRTDIEGETLTSFQWLRKHITTALSKAIVGMTHGLHGHIEYNARQIIPGYATDKDVILRHASLYLKGGLKPATGASGKLDLAGTDGAVLPAGSIFQRNGFDYITAADAVIAAGIATVNVSSSVNADDIGQDTNVDEGLTLSLNIPVAGINSKATVSTGGLTGGTNQETFDALNLRIRERIQASPNGSNNDQYIVWAREVAGVTRAWSYSNWLGYGTVGLFFVRDDDASLIPDAAEVQTVQDYIDKKRPAGMKGFSAIAPTPVNLNFDIQLSPNTVAVQTAVETAIRDLLRNASSVEDGSGNATLPISHIREVISTATDEYDHALVLPAADVTLNKGELLLPGSFTWSAL